MAQEKKTSEVFAVTKTQLDRIMFDKGSLALIIDEFSEIIFGLEAIVQKKQEEMSFLPELVDQDLVVQEVRAKIAAMGRVVLHSTYMIDVGVKIVEVQA